MEAHRLRAQHALDAALLLGGSEDDGASRALPLAAGSLLLLSGGLDDVISLETIQLDGATAAQLLAAHLIRVFGVGQGGGRRQPASLARAVGKANMSTKEVYRLTQQSAAARLRSPAEKSPLLPGLSQPSGPVRRRADGSFEVQLDGAARYASSSPGIGSVAVTVAAGHGVAVASVTISETFPWSHRSEAPDVAGAAANASHLLLPIFDDAVAHARIRSTPGASEICVSCSAGRGPERVPFDAQAGASIVGECDSVLLARLSQLNVAVVPAGTQHAPEEAHESACWAGSLSSSTGATPAAGSAAVGGTSVAELRLSVPHAPHPTLQSHPPRLLVVTRTYVFNLLNDGHMLTLALPLPCLQQPTVRPASSAPQASATVALRVCLADAEAGGLTDVTSPTHELGYPAAAVGPTPRLRFDSLCAVPSQVGGGGQSSGGAPAPEEGSGVGLFLGMLEPENGGWRWTGLRGHTALVVPGAVCAGRSGQVLLPPGLAALAASCREAVRRGLQPPAPLPGVDALPAKTAIEAAAVERLFDPPSLAVACSGAALLPAGGSTCMGDDPVPLQLAPSPMGAGPSPLGPSGIGGGPQVPSQPPPPPAVTLRPGSPSIPTHIAIVMDGNGRWATGRGLPRSAGHTAGVDAIHRVIRSCRRLHVRVLTLYAFSAQNWSRPPEEVKVLMGLLARFVATDCEELVANGVRLLVNGDMARLPVLARLGLERLIAASAHNEELVLCLALSYGGREEIAAAAAAAATAVVAGSCTAESLSDPVAFRRFLPHPWLPDPDLLIRTSGELRVSNFLLWHIAYAEIHVTQVLWPDFGEEHLLEAVADYARRERRFGKTSAQVKGGAQSEGGQGRGGADKLASAPAPSSDPRSRSPATATSQVAAGVVASLLRGAAAYGWCLTIASLFFLVCLPLLLIASLLGAFAVKAGITRWDLLGAGIWGSHLNGTAGAAAPVEAALTVQSVGAAAPLLGCSSNASSSMMTMELLDAAAPLPAGLPPPSAADATAELGSAPSLHCTACLGHCLTSAAQASLLALNASAFAEFPFRSSKEGPDAGALTDVVASAQPWPTVVGPAASAADAALVPAAAAMSGPVDGTSAPRSTSTQRTSGAVVLAPPGEAPMGLAFSLYHMASDMLLHAGGSSRSYSSCADCPHDADCGCMAVTSSSSAAATGKPFLGPRDDLDLVQQRVEDAAGLEGGEGRG